MTGPNQSGELVVGDDFPAIAELLGQWPERSPQAAALTGLARRLERTLALVRRPDLVGALDVAALVRQALRRESERYPGSEISLTCPREQDGSAWPTREQWAASGVNATPAGAGHYRLVAGAWQPGWLKAERDPAAAANAEAARRHQHPVPADPFVRAITRYEDYTTPGQREAIRAATYVLDGSTLCAILPTGSGKSLVAHLPALLPGARDRLTIVVVPTVALALDQERAFAQLAGELAPAKSAYHGGLSREEKQAFQERIQAGEQRIIFTSPEALLGSLSGVVHEVAATGRLAYLVLDEAHLVAQWGAEFRPEFQALAGFRRQLLRASPDDRRFRTLLMTATLTGEDLRTMHALFSWPGPFQVVAAAPLRPEPEYWQAYCPSEWLRRERLTEALRHLPRPLIVYTTRRDAAEAFHAQLKEAGYRRLDLMTGSTPSNKRESLLRRWRNADLDLVVATSAFGVGVDQADVRAVVHACIPETVDRYYQEVGRSGRDGRASLSLVLHTQRDREDAYGLSQPTLIGEDRGLERWGLMFSAATHLADGRVRVPITVRPPDLNFEGNANAAWNVRTLNLMGRAGLIELTGETPPRESDYPSESHYRAALHKFEESATLRLLEPAHLDEAVWIERVGAVREQSSRASQAGLKLMWEALDLKRDIAKVFLDAYRVSNLQLPGDAPVNIEPQASCGGCQDCRAQERPPYAALDPEPAPVKAGEAPLAPWWREHYQGQKLLGVHYAPPPYGEEESWRAQAQRLVHSALEGGFRNLVCPESVLDREALEALWRESGNPFLWEPTYRAFSLPELPTIVILDPGASELPEAFSASAPTLLVFPEGTRDSERPDLALTDTLPAFRSLHWMLKRLP